MKVERMCQPECLLSKTITPATHNPSFSALDSDALSTSPPPRS